MKIQNSIQLLALVMCSSTTQAFTFAPTTRTTTASRSSWQQLYAADGDDMSLTPPPPPKPDGDKKSKDILNSAAFLRRKIDVLVSDINAVDDKIKALNVVYEENKAEWGPQIDDLQKEYANIQKRLKDRNSAENPMVVREVAQSLLAVLDNYDRAFTAVEPETDDQKAIEASYKDVHANILTTLEGLGVKPVDTVGIEFDYEFHQAVMMRPDEDHEEGIVCEELAKGYAMEDGTLIRAAMVVVAA